ncbi:MAG: hypothetical protein ACRDTG_24150 [Pseudonocardiaceae bacterium]
MSIRTRAGKRAQRYFEVALRCSQQSANWDLWADAYSNPSRMLAYCGDGDTALTMSQQSQIRPDRLSPLARACMTVVEAIAHGRCGDAQSCLAAVRRAEEHFASAVPANETATMLDFFSPAELAGDSGYALLPLAMRGQHVGTTVELLRSAATSYPADKARSRGLTELRLASLLLTHGDPAEAVAMATGALDDVGSVRSRRIADLLTNLQRRTGDPRHRCVAGIAPLRHRISDTLAV